MTTERDLRWSIEMVAARKAWKQQLVDEHVRIVNFGGFVNRAFDAGYKAALEDHADCHPSDDLDICMEAVKAASRE